MRTYQENTDTLLADNDDTISTAIPEPFESWPLEDFADLIPQNR